MLIPMLEILHCILHSPHNHAHNEFMNLEKWKWIAINPVKKLRLQKNIKKQRTFFFHDRSTPGKPVRMKASKLSASKEKDKKWAGKRPEQAHIRPPFPYAHKWSDTSSPNVASWSRAEDPGQVLIRTQEWIKKETNIRNWKTKKKNQRRPGKN